MNVKGKVVSRHGRNVGQKKGYKKAIVRLAEGDKIDVI